jgi:hypothetical protein
MNKKKTKTENQNKHNTKTENQNKQLHTMTGVIPEYRTKKSQKRKFKWNLKICESHLLK